MNPGDYGVALAARAATRGHRQLLVLEGSHSWQQQTARALVEHSESLWLTCQTPPPEGWIIPHQARQLLGQETGCVIVDLNHGVDADSIGILAGTIRAGGLMVFLLADTQLTDKPLSPYMQRLTALLRSSENSIVLNQHTPWPDQELPHEPAPTPATLNLDHPAVPATDCQRHALEGILAVVSGQRKRPAILVSDRGRGKSAALGMAAGQLLGSSSQRILVTGSRRAGSAAIFHHAAAVLGSDEPGLQWCDAKSLITAPQSCQLLIIDEAATLPLPILEQLLNIYSRIAMATTVHGYEGTGRGFLLRFQHTLDRVTRGWCKVRLTTPVRWADGDPLERDINRLLVLDAETADISGPPETTTNPQNWFVETLSPWQLGGNESLLREVFSLLVLSHYKTRPNDLQQLLDNPALQICRICASGASSRQTLGITLVVREGELSGKQGQAIATGQRRPAGHMLPEILAINGLPEAAALKVMRVMRIVVHPCVRRLGLGSKMLQHLHAGNADTDLFGTSFGLSGSLVEFWRKNGYQLIQLGEQRTLQSGRHSGTFVRANSSPSKTLCKQARESFWGNFPARLGTSLQDLETAIVQAIIHGETGLCMAPGESRLRDVASVANSVRDPRSVPAALTQAAMHGLAHNTFHDPALLIQRILQHRNWENCHGFGGDAGWRQGNQRLREAFREYLSAHGAGTTR